MQKSFGERGKRVKEELSLEELKEQLQVLNKAQNETENAYWENLEMRDKSILADWAQEILEREKEINAVKEKIANHSKQQVTEDKKTEETSLVDISKLTPLQWIRQRIHQMRVVFKRDVIDKAPGIPEENLRKLREEKLNHYREMLDTHQKQNRISEEKEFDKSLKSKGIPSQEEQKKMAEEWKDKTTQLKRESPDLETK